MSRAGLIFNRVVDAWPFFGWLLCADLHFFFYRFSGVDHAMVNKIVGALLGFAGLITVIYSINSNFALFRETNLFRVFVDYIRSLSGKTRLVSVSADFQISWSSSGRMHVTSNPTTIEERLAELERQAEIDRNEAARVEKELRGQILKVQGEMTHELEKTRADLRGVVAKLDETIVGGFKQQLFGGFLVGHAAVTSIFA